MVRKRYNAKYHKTYFNRCYVLKSDFIKYTRISRKYSRIELRAEGFVYLIGSPYSDAEVSSNLRSYLHDAIINASPRKGGK